MSKIATPPVTRGYPDLAKIMGAHKGMSMYLRFSDLNARDLLVYQAEILQLEQLLETQDRKTPWSKTHILKPDGEKSTPMEEEHWKVQMQLRCKLKEYSMSNITPGWHQLTPQQMKPFYDKQKFSNSRNQVDTTSVA